jgi:cell wall-associated NlpC family hydrolase
MDPLIKTGDKIDAALGIGDHKYSSIEERIKTIFTTSQSTLKEKADYGDIIGVSRGVYEHYGIYLGNNRVIHYTSFESDISMKNTIMETDMSHFLRDSSSYFIFNCENQEKSKIIVSQSAFKSLKNLFASGLVLEIYTPKETVERAKSRLNEDEYHLALNNCEHFAIWCKTGVSKSYQIDQLLSIWKKYP